jgi:hypothetical protein
VLGVLGVEGGGGVLDEGGGHISCGGVGSKGERETKTIMCVAHEVVKGFVELRWGRGGQLWAVFHTN